MMKGWLAGAKKADPFAFVPPAARVAKKRGRPVAVAPPEPTEDKQVAAHLADREELIALEKEIREAEELEDEELKKAKGPRVYRGSKWTLLMDNTTDVGLSGEMVSFYARNTYAATKLRFGARVKAFTSDDTFVPEPTLARWATNAVSNEPMKRPHPGRVAHFTPTHLELLLDVLLAIRDAGIPVDWKTTRRQARSIVLRFGLLDKVPKAWPRRSWCRKFVNKSGLTRRKATKEGRKELPADAEAIEERFILQTASLIEEHNIPRSLVINSDETSINFVDLGKYTLAPKGATQVRVVGSSDKRAITGTTATSAFGDVLGLQLIWTGNPKSTRAIPHVPVPKDWLQLQTLSHWQTNGSFVEYTKNVNVHVCVCVCVVCLCGCVYPLC